MSSSETELRLGLPGNNNEGDMGLARKRGFYETQQTTVHHQIPSHHYLNLNLSVSSSKDQPTPLAKAQVVGWPPIRSHRKNKLALALQKRTANANHQQSDYDDDHNAAAAAAAMFVKVSLDGAPYLRKVDLTIYNSYKHLSQALANLFSSFTIHGNCGSSQSQATGNGIKSDFVNNERKLIDLLNASDYVSTYQDKDGDWMLVGDVPWQMFVETCKRLHIMKGKEANGLAPRVVEKCIKNFKF